MAGASTTGPIVVRTGQHYPYRFNVTLGQRNTKFVSGAVTPHNSARLPVSLRMRRLMGVALIEPGRYDLLHLKNAVPLFHSAPYVMTFEDYLPRVPEDYYFPALHRLLLRALSRDRCRRIIAQSEYGLRQFIAQNRHLPEFEAVRAKIEVLRPALDVKATRPKSRGTVLKLLFVGHDFLRKGGPVLTRAHERLRQAGVQVETTLVTNFRLEPDDYVGPRDEALNGRERERAIAAGVRLAGSLPADKVSDMMAEADFVILPTIHDTFGFVALEAMAVGTPVIATDTCALPEIIDHGVNGWLLPLANDALPGRWEHLYKVDQPGYSDLYLDVVERLGAHLADTLARHLAGEGDYRAMSAAAIETIKSRFSKEKARDRLEEIYRLAVSGEAIDSPVQAPSLSTRRAA